MANLHDNRLSIAMIVGLTAVIGQLAAFGAIAHIEWRGIFSTPSTLPLPLPVCVQVLNNELIYPSVTPEVLFGAVRMNHLNLVDPRSGRIRQIACKNSPTLTGMVSLGRQCWFTSQHTVCWTDGQTFEKYEPKRSLTSGIVWPFDYEGQLAVIDTDLGVKSQLLVFEEGEWVEKGVIALPGGSRPWRVNKETGVEELVPRTSAEAIGKSTAADWTIVVPANGTYHLFQHDSGPRICYRAGFDFVTAAAPGSAISALAPANAEADTTGWVQLDRSIASRLTLTTNLQAAHGDAYFAADGTIWRIPLAENLTSTSTLEQIATLDLPESGYAIVCPNNAGDTQYVIVANRLFDADVFQLDGRQLQRLPVHLDGMFDALKRRLAGIVGKTLAVLIVTTIILVLVSDWITRRAKHAFGHSTVPLATIGRRFLARCVDLTVVFGPVAIESVRLAWQIEEHTFFEALQQEELPLVPFELSLCILWTCVLWALLVASTSWWGVTPGKWLFGVRVVRTTLRPCGVLPALLRELLLFLDAPQLLFTLPGLLCCLATQSSQRIGDLAAGTIVIDATGRSLNANAIMESETWPSQTDRGTRYSNS